MNTKEQGLMDQWEIRHYQRIAAEIYAMSLMFLDYAAAMLEEDPDQVRKMRSLYGALVDQQRPIEFAHEYDSDDPDRDMLGQMAFMMGNAAESLRTQITDKEAKNDKSK
ncbi:MAG: hypothetical protein NC311_15395 [Muribaculaceae bacterium]|nr:hypothetical protein [Muribaculaceae bacterium]